MRAIDKFILHVVHNWKNELNEAYSEKAIQGFINKFKEEADDLNINITDGQLKAYINTFDRIKEKLPGDQRDLTKWTLSRFIKFVTSTKGDEGVEEIDITPDVVYNNENNTIVIYNGSKEDNCIRYGRGESWCITKTSFSSYRYSEDRGYPTFYLAKNNNLPESDKLSFVAIQVRDPQMTREDGRYVYTNRKNSPYESNPMNFERLMSEIPWLRDIPNIKSILKYIPLSSAEKSTQLFKQKVLSYRKWANLPFSAKQQYLVVRKNGTNLFNDVTTEEFVEKYLPKFPELLKFVSETPGIFNNILLLKNLDLFPNQIRRSITANIQTPLDLKYIKTSELSFDVKKLLVQLNKWKLGKNDKLYITKEGDTIVKLVLGDKLNISLYQDEDDFENIKLNKRTVKYLLDYPEIDSIPFKTLLNLSSEGLFDANFITNLINKAKEDPESHYIVKTKGEDEFLIDSNSLTSYKITNGSITSVPFTSEEVQSILKDETDNEGLQQGILNIFKSKQDIPAVIDKESLINIIKDIPYDQRVSGTDVLLTVGDGSNNFLWAPRTLEARSVTRVFVGEDIWGTDRDWRIFRSGRNSTLVNDNVLSSYFTYLRQTNQSYNDEQLLSILNASPYIIDSGKKSLLWTSNPPVNPNNNYKLVRAQDKNILLNSANPALSKALSPNSGKMIKANVPRSVAARLLGGTVPAAAGAPAVPADGVRRRGRPAGQPNAQRAAPVAAAPAEGGISVANRMQETGLTAAFNQLPRGILRRLGGTATRVTPAGDRGAARRNNQLGARGSVGQVLQIGASKIYFIRLASGTIIASINVQPGNFNYILTGNNMISLNSPSELVSTLQQRGIAESRDYIVKEYLSNNPTHLNEFKTLIQQHINEKKKNEK
jgi:hypothetical protein